MRGDEVVALSDDDALRAYSWLVDTDPQAARSMARLMRPEVTRLGTGEMQMLGAAMIRCPGPVELRRLYPDARYPLSGGNDGGQPGDTGGSGPTDGPPEQEATDG